jgi:quercetin dioxygenase-like cupin family protein
MLNDLDSRVAADALGLLTEAEQETLRREMPHAPVPEHTALYDIAGELAQSCTPIEPPPDIRARLLSRVTASPRPRIIPPLSFVMRDEGWQPHPVVAGIQFKQLALDERLGVATLLLKVAPGTIYPAHHHRGNEECYVIDGDVTAGGRQLRAGDFHHADAGSDHEPLSTVDGCTVLLVVDSRDYLG